MNHIKGVDCCWVLYQSLNFPASVSDVTVYLRGSLWKFLITAVKACCSQTKLHVKRLLNKVGEQCLDVVYADRSKKKKDKYVTHDYASKLS